MAKIFRQIGSNLNPSAGLTYGDLVVRKDGSLGAVNQSANVVDVGGGWIRIADTISATLSGRYYYMPAQPGIDLNVGGRVKFDSSTGKTIYGIITYINISTGLCTILTSPYESGVTGSMSNVYLSYDYAPAGFDASTSNWREQSASYFEVTKSGIAGGAPGNLQTATSFLFSPGTWKIRMTAEVQISQASGTTEIGGIFGLSTSSTSLQPYGCVIIKGSGTKVYGCINTPPTLFTNTSTSQITGYLLFRPWQTGSNTLTLKLLASNTTSSIVLEHICPYI